MQLQPQIALIKGAEKEKKVLSRAKKVENMQPAIQL